MHFQAENSYYILDHFLDNDKYMRLIIIFVKTQQVGQAAAAPLPLPPHDCFIEKSKATLLLYVSHHQTCIMPTIFKP